MDQTEIDYWCKEFPSLDRQEVIDILEAIENDENNND